ncbi:unnamed protein product [Knipowitschia caucasica]
MKRRSTTLASRGRCKLPVQWEESKDRVQWEEPKGRLSDIGVQWEEPKDRLSDVSVQWEEPKDRLSDVGVQWEKPKDRLSDVGVQWEEPKDRLSDVGVQWEEPKDRLSDVGVQWEEPKDRLSDVGVQWEELKDRLSDPLWCKAAVQVDLLGLSCSVEGSGDVPRRCLSVCPEQPAGGALWYCPLACPPSAALLGLSPCRMTTLHNIHHCSPALEPSPVTTLAVPSCAAQVLGQTQVVPNKAKAPGQAKTPDGCMAPLSSDESDSQLKDDSTALLSETIPKHSLSSSHSDPETLKPRRKMERAAGLPLRYLLDYALETTGGDPVSWGRQSACQSKDLANSKALTEGRVKTEGLKLNRSQKVVIKKELKVARISEHGPGMGRPKTNSRISIDIKDDEVKQELVLEGDLERETIPLGDVLDVERGLVKKMQILSGEVAAWLKPPSLDSGSRIKLELKKVEDAGGGLSTEFTQGSTGIKLRLSQNDTPEFLVFRDDQSNALTLILPCVVKLLRQPEWEAGVCG